MIRRLNPSETSYRNTGLYIYHLKKPNDLLTEIIDKVIQSRGHDVYVFLEICYRLVINQNLFDVICDMIDSDNHRDKIYIYMTAVKNNRADIIDLLAERKFNFNQLLCPQSELNEFMCPESELNELMWFDNACSYIPCVKENCDILAFAVSQNNHSMVIKLMYYGADINANDQPALMEACEYDNNIIFDYFLDLGISYKYLCRMFTQCCLKNNIVGMQKLSKNINVHDVLSVLNDSIGSYTVDVVKFLLDNDYISVTDGSLYLACTNLNYELADFLLNYGIKPSADTIKNILLNVDIKIIGLLTKYRVDMSMLKPYEKYTNTVNNLLECNIEPYALITYFLNVLEEFELSIQMKRSSDLIGIYSIGT